MQKYPHLMHQLMHSSPNITYGDDSYSSAHTQNQQFRSRTGLFQQDSGMKCSAHPIPRGFSSFLLNPYKNVIAHLEHFHGMYNCSFDNLINY